MAKYIISYDKNVDLSTLQTALMDTGCTINETFTGLGVMLVESSNTDFFFVTGVLAHELEPEITVTEQWHLNRICSQQLPMRPVYVSRNKGAGATVYLVDSGVSTTHEELSSADIQHLWSWDGNFTDTSGHGTALASLIVGKTLGVSSEATLKSVKIPMGESISISVLLNAFNTILSDHQLTPGVKVVNCSWSIPKSMILDNKIIELQDYGLVFVAAAGNHVIDSNNLSPVGLDTVLGVAASDAYDRVISWGTGAGSNWGPEVDITSPGIDVSVLTASGEIKTSSGTSLAAAIVSGAVCQFIVDNPSVNSAAAIQNIVLTSAKYDMLFRNENIYGTTPNALLHIPFAELIVSPSKENRVVEIQKGTTLTIPVQLTFPATSIKINDFTLGVRRRTAPDWVTLADNTLTISPSTSIDSGNYVLEIDILDANGASIGYSLIIMKVYNTSIEELSEDENYIYHTINEDGMVVVLQSVCSGFCYGNGTCQAISKSCFCVGYGCSQT